MRRIGHNIVKMYFFRFLRDFWLIMPMIIPFYRTFGLTAAEILVIQSVFSLSLLAFEIPSGYFSDVMGRRLTLTAGAASLPVGLAIYSTGTGFWHFALAEAVLGFGFALCSGTESALIYDTLLEENRSGEYQKIEGRSESMSRIGTAAASVLGGALAYLYLMLPFYCNIATGILMCVAAITLVEPGRTMRRSDNPMKDVVRIVRYSLGHRRILRIMVLSATVLVTGIISVWGYLFLMGANGLSVAANGVGFALFQASSAFGAVSSHRISGRIGRKNSYRLIFLIPAMLVAIGILRSPAALLLAPLHAFVWGFSFPFFMDELNSLIQSEVRATVLSTGSMVGRLLFIAISPLFGFLLDRYTPASGFTLLAGIFLIAGLTGAILRKSDGAIE
ncbi:MAG: MFS transporter [Spirochaetes bacterium]|nr:MFS transporter [Spirochaetota bacterium]